MYICIRLYVCKHMSTYPTFFILYDALRLVSAFIFTSSGLSSFLACFRAHSPVIFLLASSYPFLNPLVRVGAKRGHRQSNTFPSCIHIFHIHSVGRLTPLIPHNSFIMFPILVFFLFPVLPSSFSAAQLYPLPPLLLSPLLVMLHQLVLAKRSSS